MIFSQAYWQQFFSGVATATRENFHVPSFLAFLGVYICLTGIIKLVMRPVPSHIQSMKKPRKEAGLYHGETVSFIHATLAVVLGTPLPLTQSSGASRSSGCVSTRE